MLLKDKVILITGSSTGIGAAIARRCIKQGAKVMLHGRDEARTQAMCEELGDAARYTIASLEDLSNCTKLINATVDAFGAIHGLVNNAAIYPRNTIDSANIELFDRIMAINVKAPLFLTQAATQMFRQQKTGGSIVNIGSINAYCGQPDLLCYSMSKGALMTMTRNLADSLGPEKIRVNQLNVGWTPTDNEVALKQQEGLPADWETRIPPVYAPIGRLQTPDNVAAHVTFWLSDESIPTNGAVYEVEQYPVIGRNRLSDLKISAGDNS
jgi:NAD(P)-dependent dehydrogenase (short-subunit alcohol dehydrogenase family)